MTPVSGPSGPSGAPPDRDTAEPYAVSGGLHGRMLHVSRLATIGEMAAGIAHELNQPLTAIANYAQTCDRLLGQPNPPLSDLRSALREIAAQAVRAGEIIRRVRTLARSQPVERSSTDLNSVIHEILELMQTDACVHGARLRLELADGLSQVSIDRVQIPHVILNLVRNALEALSQGGCETREVRICSRRAEGGDVEIAVCDTGPGVSAQELERIFDPFFSTKSSGTGLGLPISNTVVRAHGGTLAHRPNQPAGACFYVFLPPEAAE